MKNLSICLLSSILVASPALADSYLSGGVKWTYFGAKISEDIYLEDGKSIDTSFSSLIVPEGDRTIGYDVSRINSVVPYINIEENKDYGRFGATLQGFYPFKSFTSEATGVMNDGVIPLRLNSPAKIYSDLGEVQELPFLEYSAVNKIVAETTIVSEKSEKFFFSVIPVFDDRNNFRNWEDQAQWGNNTDRSQRCFTVLSVNGEEVDLKVSDQMVGLVDLNQGENSMKVEAWCNAYNKDDNNSNVNQGYTFRGSYDYDDGFDILGLGFQVVPRSTGEPLQVKEYSSHQEKVDQQQTLQAKPTLYVWENIGEDGFIAPSDLDFTSANDVTGVQSSLEEVDFEAIELLSPLLQAYDLEDEIHSKRYLVKGTFFPKKVGTYEVLVLKRSNIVGIEQDRSGNPVGDPHYHQPVYSLSFDYSKPVAHSKRRDTSISDIPMEYDWFFFDVSEENTVFGMDMSFYAKGVVGQQSNRIEKSILRITPGGASILDRRDALAADILASQTMALYIKEPGASDFRPLMSSDFNGDGAQVIAQKETPQDGDLGELDAFAFD